MKATEKVITGKRLSEILRESEPVITQRSSGEIVVEMEISPFKYNTKKENITVCKYSGSMYMNNGLLSGDKFPLDITEHAKTIWNSFVDNCENEMLEFIKNN